MRRLCSPIVGGRPYSPVAHSPQKPPTTEKRKPPPCPPPLPPTHQTQKGPQWQAQVLQGEQLIVVGPRNP